MPLNRPRTLIKCVATLVFCIGFVGAFGKSQSEQLHEIDSIHKLLVTMVNFSADSAKILLDDAAEKIRHIDNKELAAKYWAENNLRRADYWVFSDPTKAKYFLDNAYYYFINNLDNAKLADIYCLKAQLTRQEGRGKFEAIKAALPYFDTALAYVAKVDDPRLTAFLYYEKAIALQQLERWEESFENAFKSLQFAEISGDSLNLATTYFLMGRTYTYFGFTGSSEEYLKKAIEYGKGMEHLYAIMHLYAEILLKNGKTDLSLQYYQRVLEISLAKKMYKKAIDVSVNIGSIQFNNGDYKAAEETLKSLKKIVEQTSLTGANYMIFAAQMHIYKNQKNQALAKLTQFKTEYSNQITSALGIDIYRNAADLFEELNQHKDAALFYRKWGQLKDSISAFTSKLQLSELEKMYLKERDKNQEITLANAELKKSRSQQAWLGISLIILTILGGAFIYFIRMRGLKETQALKFQIKEKQLEQLIETQEVERQRLARELHDGIGQSLAALKMQLQFDENIKATDLTVARVDLLCKEVRSLSHQMMPIVLQENGLKAAIEQLVEQAFSNAAIEVDFVTLGMDGRLPDNVEVHLYRITQELFTNVIKHAEATKVGVQLMHRNKHILLIIEDNGIGFEKNESNTGMGFSNINSRIESLAGTLKVQSSKADGTYIRIAVPIAAQGAKKTA